MYWIKCLVRKYLILRYDVNYFPWVVVMVVFLALEISFSGIKFEFLIYKPTRFALRNLVIKTRLILEYIW
ncbi:hypothetical protein LDENG_00090420 [Lucifuga dentata]|nr:hypothetical protein LDENG_00090420 [Lucifuga dentata]